MSKEKIVELAKRVDNMFKSKVTSERDKAKEDKVTSLENGIISFF